MNNLTEAMLLAIMANISNPKDQLTVMNKAKVSEIAHELEVSESFVNKLLQNIF